ncbi:PAS domain-containing protein [Sphingomonas adhaesiva]|uniref:PAS domain-containing protein n=1 Tax=Sphingomonas adhaesiva TaxID=28212 RepID=UPI002FF7521F
MDTARGYDDLRQDSDPTEGGVGEPQVQVGADERRMHVRAYNHWVSLLRDRPYPAIEDLEPASIADFGPHSVLLDFTAGLDDPAIQYIGRALRDECAVDQTIERISDVPARSLLSRLTDHYLQIIANRAPIGFEAEFVGTRGHNTLYRGILMPFSSDGTSIDFIYGVINWKEMIAAEEQAALDAELSAAVVAPRHDPVPAPAWADGPGAGTGMEGNEEAGTLDERLAAARDSVASARAAATRSHAALYRALGRAYDFAIAAEADPEALGALLTQAEIKPQARAPMTAIAKLVFGRDHDKTRLTEAATVLAYAARTGVPEGGLPRVLEAAAGGIKGIVAEERAARRPAAPTRRAAGPKLDGRAPVAELAIPSGLEDGAPVILIGRATATGIAVIGTMAQDEKLTARVLRRLA